MRLDVRLPYVPNSIPLISTMPMDQGPGPLSLVTHPPSRLQHNCSTLTNPTSDSRSLLDPLPSSSSSSSGCREAKSLVLHRHLDLDSCHWRFSTWHCVSELVSDCGAVVGGAEARLDLVLYVRQVHFGGTLSVTARPPPSPLHLPLSTDPPLTPPFLLVPPGPSSGDTSLLPVSVEHGASVGDLVVYLLTTSHDHQPLSADSSLTLLHSASSLQGYKQAWQLDARASSLKDVTLTVVFSSCPSPLHPCRVYSFPLLLSLQPSPSFATTVHASLTRSPHGTNRQGSTATEVFDQGEVVYGTVALDASQRLRPGFRLEVLRVVACPLDQSRPQESCDDAALLLTILVSVGSFTNSFQYFHDLSWVYRNESAYNFFLSGSMQSHICRC